MVAARHPRRPPRAVGSCQPGRSRPRSSSRSSTGATSASRTTRGITFDLEFEARNGPYQINQPPIRHNGRLIHHDVYVFQTGFFSGSVTLDDERFEVERVPGARDRTWGVRVAGEGQLPYGVLAWLNANFDGVSIVAHIRDGANETPQVRDGAVYHDGGAIVPIVEFEHDLEFDHDTRQCLGGTITLTDATGEVWPVEIDPTMRIYLSGGGYTSTAHPPRPLHRPDLARALGPHRPRPRPARRGTQRQHQPHDL